MAVELTPNIYDPNLIIPLACSVNTRGIAGFTNLSSDQRKINCIYEPVQNSITQGVTLHVAKRPGVADTGSTYGTSGQVAYLWDIAAGATTSAAATRWVFSTSGDDVRVSNTSTTTVIATAAGYAPAFVDKTIIGGVDTVVLQLRNASGTQRVFYGTAIGTWTEISDVDFTTLAHQGKMEFLNGTAYTLHRTTNRIYNSELDSLSSWPTTGYITKQITQDIGTGLAKYGNTILAFGESTMERFRDNGNPLGSPLVADPSGFQRIGLSSTIVTGMRHYYTILDRHMYWPGNNPKGIYAYNGETVEKVSNNGVDKIITERQIYHVGNLTFGGQKAVVFCLDLPSATTQRSLLFFPDWREWFEWTSTVFIPQTSPRLTDVCLGVGTSQHKLYSISTSSENYQDAGTDYTMTIQFELPTDGLKMLRAHMFGVTGDTARSSSTLNISWSRDDYQNFTTARTIDMTKPRKAITHCGASRQWAIKLTHSGNLDCRIENFIARIE